MKKAVKRVTIQTKKPKFLYSGIGSICEADILEEDYEIKEAVVTKDKISIDFHANGSDWCFLATSIDGGFVYQGNYGNPTLSPSRTIEIWRFTSCDGSELLLVKCNDSDDPEEAGVDILRLWKKNIK